MDTRRLLSATLLYGLADVVVAAVGGLLLLPLYTRTLTQDEFGVYVIVRANTEIFTYLLYFGLPSAVARVYFDYRARGEHAAYVSSVLMFFLLNLSLWAAVLALWGDAVWRALSPSTPVQPWLWFSFAIAAAGFFSALGSMLLRLESRVRAFAVLQIAASFVLAATAVFNLVGLKLGLPGLLIALLVGSACAAMVLPWQLGRGFRPTIKLAHLAETLRFAAPLAVGYIAYFVLNRVSTLILQRHVAVAEIAIFGLAQQLAMIVAIAGSAFGKVAQPAVFAAAPEHATDLMTRSARILILLMFCVCCAVVLFASELFAMAAPKSYADGRELLAILAVAGLAYSFNFISDTALLYHRRPTASVAVSLLGAGLSAVLALLLIPVLGLRGAAFAIAGAFVAMTLAGQWLTTRLTGHSSMRPMLVALAAAIGLAVLVTWLQGQHLGALTFLAVRVAIAAAIASTILRVYIKRSPVVACTT